MSIVNRRNPMSGEWSFLDEEREIFYSRIIGGLVWPSVNSGAVVVIGEGDVWKPPRPAHVLAEFEESAIGDLIKRCSFLTRELSVQDFYGRPDKTCLRYLDQFNSEARQNRMKQFYFKPAASNELPMDYHYNLLRDRLTPGKKTIHFSEGSQLKGLLLSVPENEVITEDVHYPLVSALAYCVAALAESEGLDKGGMKSFSDHEYDVLNH